MKNTFAVVLIAWFCSFCTFAEKATHGIVFKSGTELINQRTSLILFEDNPQKFKNNFSLSFDLSFWDIRRFGYILRIINEDEKEISLVFVNFRGENDLFLDFNSAITNKSLQIPIDKNDLKGKKWIKLRLEFDLKADSARLFLQDKSYTFRDIGLHNNSSLKFVYGLYGTNLDVPQIAIRDIRIEEQGKLKFAFPLNESEGESVHDSEGKVQGRAKNPEWIINHHFNWKEETSFYSDCTAGVAYDEVNNRIFVVNRTSLSIYDAEQNTRQFYKISPLPFTVFSGEAIYNPKENSCYVYDLDPVNKKPVSLAIIDMNDFAVKTGNPSVGNTLHHHDVFWGNNDSVLYIFGGYGNFSYSNQLYRYDKNADKWDPVQLTGDHINPRFFSASGQGASSSEVLIFGGFGNESGKQELGGRNLFDLFSIDLETKNVKKRWEIKEPSTLFVPSCNLVLNEEKTHFYTLCCPHHLVKTTTQLYKFSLSDGSYEAVGNPISMLSEKINTTVYLFYNREAQKLYAVIREYVDDWTSEVRVYSLFFPPVSSGELKASSVKAPAPFQFLPVVCVALSVVLLCIALTVFWKRNKRKQNFSFPEAKVTEEQRKNAIFVFGNFTVFDNNGTDITYRFSTKLKSLFGLILFNSKCPEEGISTEKLTAELWPEKDVNSAKNIRGVTINHLRNILADIDGITLVHQSSKWFFTFEKQFYCDYIRCLHLMEGIEKQDEGYVGNTDELSEILKRGILFPQLQDAWIDSYKSDFEYKVEKILRLTILNLYQNKENHRLVRLSEIYFMIDPLNEEILDLSLKAFKKMGKAKQARMLYDRFAANYKASMGEEYRK